MAATLYPYRCLSPTCQASGDAHATFYAPERKPEEGALCPQCQSGKYLDRRDIIHLLAHAPDTGHIPGSNVGRFWSAGKFNRYDPLCERAQGILEEHQKANGPQSWPAWFKMTTLPEAVTCYDCLDALKEFQRTGEAKGGLWLPAAVDEME